MSDRYHILALVELGSWELPEEPSIWRSDYDMAIGDLNGDHVRIATTGAPEVVERNIVAGVRVYACGVHGMTERPMDLRDYEEMVSALKNVTDGR